MGNDSYTPIGIIVDKSQATEESENSNLAPYKPDSLVLKSNYEKGAKFVLDDRRDKIRKVIDSFFDFL